MGISDMLAELDRMKRLAMRNLKDSRDNPTLRAEMMQDRIGQQLGHKGWGDRSRPFDSRAMATTSGGNLGFVPSGEAMMDPGDFIPGAALGTKAVGKAVKRAVGQTEFDLRHLTAQKNAALPVERGGLGLGAQNTAMERAKALDYEKGWAHGSPNPDLTELKAGKYGAEGRGIYAADHMPEAGTYAGKKEGATVYPLMVNRGKTIETGAGLDAYQKMNAFSDDALSDALKAKGLDSITARQPENPQWLIDAGAIPMPERRHFVSENAANFRSPFAAFDPMRRHESDMLGFANPSLLGGMALGGGGLMAYDAAQGSEGESPMERMTRFLRERQAATQ